MSGAVFQRYNAYRKLSDRAGLAVSPYWLSHRWHGWEGEANREIGVPRWL